ncbi:hypothetical protein PR048_005472 [Dryococelus australis]|uniref:Uncharacterized protein n=1 Tax=Dryococelus australis TaxID=614101 RepID=A0ABQ9I8F2_9NEOP|nr:hypothetical protein PR048_005472 [Dryococelus australis]
MSKQKQNLLAKCCKWLLTASRNIERIELVFPVRGRSFIPPDCAFGNIQEDIKNEREIITPAPYLGIVGN